MAIATQGEHARVEGASAATRRISPHWLFLTLALGATAALQLTTVGYFFYFDDYVPFAEIVSQSRWSYVGHLLTSTDLTPNWRPLPGLLYLASYEVAGMSAAPVHVVMVVLHVATAGLLYYTVDRATGRAWAAAAGALVFGLNPAYVGALSQVTTATQVLAGFFLVATLVAVLEGARAEGRGPARAWLAASVALYILAIASHEGMAVLFPALGIAWFVFDRGGTGALRRAALRTAPLAAVALATAVAFEACGCNEGAEVWGTSYVGDQTLIYLGRLLYPVGLELPNAVAAPHAVAAIVLLAGMALTVVFGPRLAWVGAAWMLLAVAPHVFIEYFTASRYLYVPAIGYALLMASALVLAEDALSRRGVDRRLLAGAGAAAGVAVFAWFAFETVRQNRHFAEATADWRAYHADVTATWPDVPEGTRVITIGGPFQKYEYQLHILPAFAETTWGPGRTLNDYEPGSLPAQLALVSGSPFVAEYRDGRLVPIAGDGGR